MNILFLNRCFAPDPEATGQLLGELCHQLAERGHSVTVIAGQPNFATRDSCDGRQSSGHPAIRVIRTSNARFPKKSLLGRAIGLVTYSFLALWAGFFRVCRPDVIVVQTDPPFLGVLGAILSCWHRKPFTYYMQDVYPEVGLAAGRLQPGFLSKVLHFTTQLGLNCATRVIVLSKDMESVVAARGISSTRIDTVQNWADLSEIQPLSEVTELRSEWNLTDAFVVMYSGNIGNLQNLELQLRAARELQDLPIRFVIIGEGAAKERLQRWSASWNSRNIVFLPYQPKERLAESLAVADIHLLPLRRGVIGTAVPCKWYGILASGRPYIASIEKSCDIAQRTLENRCGLVIPPDSPKELAEAIRWCFHHRRDILEMGRRGRVLAEREHDVSFATDKFEQSLTQTINDAGRAVGIADHPARASKLVQQNWIAWSRLRSATAQ